MKQNYYFKRMLSALALLLVSSLSWAQYFEVDGINYYINEDRETVSVNGTYDGYSGDIVIPSAITYSGITYSVTNIGDMAFSSSPYLTSVDLPNSVTSIGNNAFYYCPLTSIDIPKSVTSIGGGAFYGCSALTSIAIPNGVTSIGDETFHYCSALTSIDIPNGVTSIGNSAFESCYSLTSVDLPNSVTSIGRYAFSRCDSLASINIPDGVTSIEMGVFSYCYALTSIHIPDGVTSIGYQAFLLCSSLTSINIPESVTSIGNMAFRSCSNLTSITIPDGVTSIGDYAFSNCSGLTSVYSLIENPFSISSNVFDDIADGTTLYVPKGTKDAYEATEGWTEHFSNVVEFNATGIVDTPAGRAESIAVYDLNGTKVNVKGGDLNSLPRGIYVVNGKKKIVK